MGPMSTALRIAIITGLLALFGTFGLVGCGVKGPLERPADAPKEETAGPDGQKPHRSFVLDRLIR